jgi:3-methyl-2-oxobutanoate hydroxymethyltransferase
VPAELAREITTRLRIPTIGIGAGPWCDGQVQVWHDMLGLYTDFVPRHTKRYANLAETMISAIQSYAEEVRAGSFPTAENGSSMDEQELQAVLRQLDTPQHDGAKASDGAPKHNGATRAGTGSAPRQRKP